jgi:predicted nuclease of predicted toxin-antitoxin system
VKWLLDAMLPPAAADELDRLGHDAVSVLRMEMGAADDAKVFERAVTDGRVMVTENFADFAALLADRQNRGEPATPVVFVRRDNLPRRGALAGHLARKLHQWARANPEPYVGLYWP